MPWRTTANDADSSVAPTSVARIRTMAIGGCGACVDATRSKTPSASSMICPASSTGGPAHRHELCVDLPPGAHRFGDQRLSLDDEATLLVTRTAAPDQAPQFLNR